MAVFILDRVTKAIVSASVAPGADIALPGRFVFIENLTNSGAAFGIRPMGSAGFLVVSIVVAIGLVVYVARNPALPLPTQALLGLIMGGTVGNGYDRVVQGAVTDFIALHWFPVFNLADSAISIAVVLLIAAQLLPNRDHPRAGS